MNRSPVASKPTPAKVEELKGLPHEDSKETSFEAALRIIGQMTEVGHAQAAGIMLSKLKASLSAEEFEKTKAAFQAKRSALEAAKGGK